MNAQHTVLDLPPPYRGGKPGRRCCVCGLPESLCGKYPRCNGKGCPYTEADAKTAARARRRKRRCR